mgnify:CR=1 FL=1
MRIIISDGSFETADESFIKVDVCFEKEHKKATTGVAFWFQKVNLFFAIVFEF